MTILAVRNCVPGAKDNQAIHFDNEKNLELTIIDAATYVNKALAVPRNHAVFRAVEFASDLNLLLSSDYVIHLSNDFFDGIFFVGSPFFSAFFIHKLGDFVVNQP